MTSVKDRVSPLLPEAVKRVLRPAYHGVRRAFTRPVVDSPSNLEIGFFGGFEVAYRKNTADEAVIWETFDNDLFYAGVPEYQSADGHVIVDVGAHIGTFSLQSSAKVGTGRVYAIEASKDSFNLLRINAALNERTNISVHHLALSDREGTCTLYHGFTNWGHSTVEKQSKSGEVVPSTTLSAFFAGNGIEECHLMKLNCEGAEFPILLSTPREVLQRVQTMLVLYHCDLWRDDTEVDLIAHLERCGFHCTIRNREESRGWVVGTRVDRQQDQG